MYRNLFRFALAVFAVLAASSLANADVTVAGFFGDHMVLQQQMPIKVWGWGEANEEVTVTLGDSSVTTRCSEQGQWKVQLPEREASKQPLKMSIQANNVIEFSDILIGEVWLCSGQSNMEWTVDKCADAKNEIANGNHPLIRHIKVDKSPSPTARDDIKSNWQICSPKTVAKFTATGYYTAVNLHKELDVPIGLVNSSWGGTRIEPWTPLQGFAQVPELSKLHAQLQMRTPGTAAYTIEVNRHRELIAQWLVQSQKSIQAFEAVTPHPPFSNRLAPLTGRQDPTALYNGMIHGLVGLPIRGVLWYQGESNYKEGSIYFQKKKALIGGWRELWKQGDFPFYFVQIAPFQYGQDNPELLAEFWEAQANTLQIPNTGMVVTNDITNIRNIHPKNKQEVGKRLAMLALKHTYKRDKIVADSPSVESIELLGNRFKVNFENTGGKLKTRDEKAPSHFEIIGVGSDGFQPATAKVEGQAIILSSSNVAAPTAFRFAWHKTAEPNLMGGTGLPVGAVRGGEVPAFLDTLSEDDTYQLVYDLDLSKLARPVVYEIDNTAKVAKFDRVAYLVELESRKFGTQQLFVSMAAFTDDINKIGVPDNATFQQTVTDLNVYSNDRQIVAGKNLPTGNIEFWPNNYSPLNFSKVKGASARLLDFGDAMTDVNPGYGSMQVHNTAAKQTLFAINHWFDKEKADIGIGNGPATAPDWTFTKNATTYTSKRLRVYARPTK